MQTSKSVQFTTVENVVNAYEMRKIPAFAIYQQKQLLYKYEGADLEEGANLLNDFIEMLQNSAGVYTLCIFEEFAGKISDKTPYHGSFNFRFQQNTAGYDKGAGSLERMNDKIEGIARSLLELKEQQLQNELEDIEPQADNQLINGMDKIGAFLSHPLIEKYIPVILNAFTSAMPGNQVKQNTSAIMAGINETDQEIITACNKMISANAQARQALIILGNLAESDPEKFKKVLGYMNML